MECSSRNNFAASLPLKWFLFKFLGIFDLELSVSLSLPPSLPLLLLLTLGAPRVREIGWDDDDDDDNDDDDEEGSKEEGEINCGERQTVDGDIGDVGCPSSDSGLILNSLESTTNWSLLFCG